jgi:hypothetical protein
MGNRAGLKVLRNRPRPENTKPLPTLVSGLITRWLHNGCTASISRSRLSRPGDSAGRAFAFLGRSRKLRIVAPSLDQISPDRAIRKRVPRCEAAPQQLSKTSEKRELAKDVSAFAGGGYILVGFATKRPELQVGEQIEALRAVPKSEFNRDQYKNVLMSWLYPVPTGLDVQFIQRGEDQDEGVVVIFVLAENDRSKPLLIKRTIEDDDPTTEVLLGYAQRRSDRSEPRTVQDLHHALKIGFNFE